MKTTLFVLLSCLSASAFASSTWERAYGGYDERNSYTKKGPSAPSADERIGQACHSEGETLQVFAGGVANYDYDTYYFEDLICCGQTLSCPVDRDREQYE